MRVLGAFTVTSVLATQSSNLKAKNPECSSPDESSVKFFPLFSFADLNYSNYNELLNENFPKHAKSIVRLET